MTSIVIGLVIYTLGWSLAFYDSFASGSAYALMSSAKAGNLEQFIERLNSEPTILFIRYRGNHEIEHHVPVESNYYEITHIQTDVSEIMGRNPNTYYWIRYNVVWSLAPHDTTSYAAMQAIIDTARQSHLQNLGFGFRFDNPAIEPCLAELPTKFEVVLEPSNGKNRQIILFAKLFILLFFGFAFVYQQQLENDLMYLDIFSKRFIKFKNQ